ncbi:MAG: signal peptidase II [Ilumatobacteraceae bacterium]
MLAAVVVAIDQITKHWALGRLGDGEVIHVLWTLQFNLAFNSGMAFGRAQGLGPVIAVVATVVIVWLLVSFRRASSRLSIVAVGLVIGGAAGNLVDRSFSGGELLRGSVIDFVDFQWFPIFNVADVAINIGGALLIIGFLVDARRAPAKSVTDE